ncbi:hypothetical protein B0J17DRAFT_445203 [Rhizoctonia solani]|nr:hypothetical protein B0J17DRAFT_445203 [Rhizoctonia solani]
MIAEIGRSVSAYVTSDYVLAAFGKDPSNVTTLDALDLPAMKTSLGHIDGRSPLMLSSDDRGMRIKRFFEYSIRNLLCRYLVKSVFEPFHPRIGPSLSQSLLATYGKLQKQDPQTNADATKHDIDPHLNKLISERLKPVLKHVFGFEVALEEEHCALIRCVIMMAWDWNLRLKGCYLVDFVPTAFRHPCRLNSELMEDFESSSQGTVNVLDTMALGLLSRTAIGGGNTVEQNTTCRTLVVTRNIHR